MLEDLRKQIVAAYPRLTEGEQRVAQYVVDHLPAVAMMSAEEVGQEVGLSDSTVIRFAVALGYPGYAALQREIRQRFRQAFPLATLQQQVAYPEATDPLTTSAHREIQGILATVQTIAPGDFQQAVRLLSQARRVFTLGMRSSYPLAAFAALQLCQVRPGVSTIAPTMGDHWDQLADLSHDDALLTISFSRYSRFTYQLLCYAEKRRCQRVVITDSLVAPVARHATVVLAVQAVEGATAHVPALVLLNTLIVSVARVDPQRSMATMNRIDQILTEERAFQNTEGLIQRVGRPSEDHEGGDHQRTH
ncbi:MAG: MurR/RpiR family transcriptional regulator [Nitrospinota bacterium]|nr:MAG: MurR/RpiR family transcriptional regulator [Nitrospinota bacterium]